ncbi:MAG: hypothetical protein OEY24_07655 [Candidatus Bathyarchaeota archaeon]|nr:hypothetical protein [Candidatus Bathyarchaeota archaeon]MDH5495555.1 hypothetical protein [Candidatus Bathyarchaeota archaeon]
MPIKERDPYLCAAGSFFFPGLGQVYCGRILRGLVFLIPAVVLTIPNAVIYLSLQFNWIDYPFWLSTWSNLLMLISKVVDFIVRALATYDAYRIAKSN